MELPVIDFSAYSLNIKDTSSVNLTDLETLANQVYEALSTVGFMYISNHGISAKLLEDMFTVHGHFFELPVETKANYKYDSTTGNHGWTALEMEGFDPDTPGDLKESFDVQYVTESNGKLWPDMVPKFKEISIEFFEKCKELAKRLLEVMAVGLKLEDREFFSKCHKRIGYKDNYTSVRTLYYPPLPSGVKPGQVRCGEHSDFGSATLLFQDDMGGLEVLCPKTGEYLPAVPKAGCVLINIGDLMQMWTSDKLVATKHRVVMPEEEFRKRKERRSIAFFMHPDDDTLVTCFDGSNKHPPITARAHSYLRFNEVYAPKQGSK